MTRQAPRLRPASRLSQSVSRAACCSGGASAEPSVAANQGLLTSMNVSHRSYCQNAYAACDKPHSVSNTLSPHDSSVAPQDVGLRLECLAVTATPRQDWHHQDALG